MSGMEFTEIMDYYGLEAMEWNVMSKSSYSEYMCSHFRKTCTSDLVQVFTVPSHRCSLTQAQYDEVFHNNS